MNVVLQPHPSSCCGQACVATIAGITLEESIKLFGNASGTSTKDLIKALEKLNIHCGDRLIRINKKNPKSDVCIVRQHFKNAKHTHWIVFIRATGENGLYRSLWLDPSWGEVVWYDPEFAWETSYLPIDVQYRRPHA